jgi:hypothetical protein
VASLVCSIVMLGGVGSLLGVVFGHVSRNQARRAGMVPSGLALAGLIIGYIGLVGLPMAAIAIPTFLDRHDNRLEVQAKTELQLAQIAQELYYSDHERYATNVPDLEPGYFAKPTVPLTIVSADSSSYCLAARHSDSDQTMYLDSLMGAVSTTPCT